MNVLEKIDAVKESVNQRFAEREELVDACFNSILTGAHLLAIGSPGTAKSAVIREVLSHLEGNVYSIQLHAYSTEKDIIGDINPKQYLETGMRSHTVSGTLLDSDYAFIDEVFKGTRGARAAMLDPLADAIFSENGVTRQLPLRAVLAASNELPSDTYDAAFYSRLQQRVLVTDLDNDSARATALWTPQPAKCAVTLTLAEIDAARAAVVDTVMPDQARETALQLFRQIDDAGVRCDQRKRQLAVGLRGSIAQAQAFLSGRDSVRPDDLWAIRHALWSKPAERSGVFEICRTLCVPAMAASERAIGQLTDMLGLKSIEMMDWNELQQALNLVKECLSPKYKGNYSKSQVSYLGEKKSAISKKIVSGVKNRKG